MEGNSFRRVDGVSLGGFPDDLHYVDGLDFKMIKDYATTSSSHTWMELAFQRAWSLKIWQSLLL